jgi:hypothetical protein
MSLMLRWYRISKGGSDHTAYHLADNGCKYTEYDNLHQLTTQMTNHAKQTIVDAPMTLIFIMGQRGYRYYLSLSRLPICALSQIRLISTFIHQTNNTYNSQCSVDSVSNISGLPGCRPGWVSGFDLENKGTHRDWWRVRTRPWFHFTVPTTFASIRYLNSHCIATWSIREMCRLMPDFICHSAICDQIIIRWVAVKLTQILRKNDRLSIATQWLLVPLHIGEWEMKEGIRLHISHID